MSKKWDYKNVNAKNIPRGAVIPAGGNAEDYETGGWRTKHPEVDMEKCINCLFCYMYCPDSSVIVKDGKLVGFDLSHCKGCGICAAECPKDAIDMENG
jgi:pyruvate ferredoxin oxidoreductase delta subunit